MPTLRHTEQHCSSSVPVVSDSMRRFSLLHRKSNNYASSASDGSNSSAAQESLSNSSRPSLSDGGRRKSSLASFGSRLKKSQSRSTEGRLVSSLAIRPQAKKSGVTLGERFDDLPAEIQTHILAYLSIAELLDLRSVSKHSLAIFQSNSVSIARNLFLQVEPSQEDGYSAVHLIHQYPAIFSSTTTDAYLFRSLRRKALVKRQLGVLITFIQTRTYMLKLTRGLESEHFGPYRNKLTARLFQPVMLLQHFLETTRHLILFAHPNHQSAESPPISIDRCARCTAQLRSTLASYPPKQILPLYMTAVLLTQHFYTATRSPSSVTIFERKLKGWGYGPPPEEHMAQLVFLGGIQELSKIDEMHGSYGKRLSVVKNFSDICAEAVRINSLAFPDFYQSGTDPVMAMAGMSGETKSKSKGKNKEVGRMNEQTAFSAVPKAIRRDKEGVRTGVEARADEVPVLKSLDVRLDLLTESVLASIPQLGGFFIGPRTLLGRHVLELKLVSDEAELTNPYALLTKLMSECYEEPEELDVV